MKEQLIRLGFCPTRRDVFSAEEARKFKRRIRESIQEFPVVIADLEGINEEGLLFQDRDIPAAIDFFRQEKVDALFFPHCNFGSENRVAQVAKALGVPVLLWGPRDDAPDASGLRSRDTQCGLFATGKVLRRYNIPFTYLTNTWVDSPEFKVGFEKFLCVVNIVRVMQNLKILQISTRPEPFCSVVCNESELIEKFNIHLYPVTLQDVLEEMKEVCAAQTPELTDTVSFIQSIDTVGDMEKIRKLAALKLAMKALAQRYDCSAIAMQCWSSLQDMIGIMPCHANALLTDEGIPTVCETDIHGAITAIMMQHAVLGGTVPFFADLTIRHPENDNAELLWHCGNFPYSLAKNKAEATVGGNVYNNNHYGVCQWELQEGDLTIARFDGDHGQYQLLIGEGHTTTGPKNVGSYVWMEVDNWRKWEHALVEGPYIHHVVGIYGKYGEILLEACKYLGQLQPDVIEPSIETLKERWM